MFNKCLAVDEGRTCMKSGVEYHADVNAFNSTSRIDMVLQTKVIPFQPLKMFRFSFLLFSLLPLISGQTRCPGQLEIHPCTCLDRETSGERVLEFDCSKAEAPEEIVSTFSNRTWPSTLLT